MLLEFLAVGTIGFYVLIAIAAILMSELLDTEHPATATFVACVTVAALAILGNFNPLPWLSANPMTAAAYLVAFFAVGTLWGVAKWYFYLRNSRRKMEEIIAEYPSYDKNDLERAFYRRGLPTKFPPMVGDHKTRILGWMMLWPASMLWTLLNDPVRYIFEEIYSRLGGMMQSISNYAFKDFNIKDKS